LVLSNQLNSALQYSGAGDRVHQVGRTPRLHQTRCHPNCRYGPLTAASRTSEPAPDLYIGPPSTPDVLVPLIEVMVIKQGHTLVIFHVQAAQQRNLDLFT
jgi:hypothetical protein